MLKRVVSRFAFSMAAALAVMGLVGCASDGSPMTGVAPPPVMHPPGQQGSAVGAAGPAAQTKGGPPTIQPPTRLPAGAIHLEAENGLLHGPTIATHRAGYSGKGYVIGFKNDGDELTLKFPVQRAGIYDVQIRFSSPFGIKGYTLVVDGSSTDGMFPGTGDQFASVDGGKAQLTKGENTLALQKGWGWYDVDYFDLIPVASADIALTAPPATPVDPQATTAARALLAYLVGQYGKKTLSGQYNQADTAYIQSNTGRSPAIMGGDFMEYSPSRIAHGSDPKKESERMISAGKAGQIVTMSWHWNAPADLVDTPAHPWYKGFYTNATTFDVQKALADPDSPDYKLLLSNMDAIATQLKKFSDAGVPVLWRPLHEAEGGWFWWGAKGPDAFKRLWQLMYDRFTNTDHLHNLIWVYSTAANPDPAWYPGDKYVDVVGIDEYPSDVTDPLSGPWSVLQKDFGAHKLIALTEFGGAPDIDKMQQFGVRWSYFVSWTGELGPKKAPLKALKQIYTSPYVIDKGELPTGV